MLKVSLPLISLFVCLFLACADKSFCQSQINDQGGTPAEAEKQRLKVMAARNEEINSLLKEAIGLYKRKQFAEAINLFNQVIRLDPQNASAYFSLAIAQEANGDLADAANNYAMAHEIDPTNNEYQKAVLSLKAKMDKEKQIQVSESKQENLALQAAKAFKAGQYEQALSLYQSLEKENPHLAFAKYNIGTIYLIFKKPDDALTYYKAAHKLEPNNQKYTESLEKLVESIKETQKNEKTAKNETTGKNEKIAPKSIGIQPSPDKKTNKERELANQSAMKNILAYSGLRVKSDKNGVLIEAILTGSRAAQVGLQPGDIIKVIDGQTIKKAKQLEKMLQSKTLGQRFQLLVVRRGQTGQILF